MASIYKTDIENRFPDYTVTVATTGSLTTCTVTVTDGGAIVARGRSGTEEGACLSVRRTLGIGEGCACCLTETQRDALESPLPGLMVFNMTAEELQTRHNGGWY